MTLTLERLSYALNKQFLSLIDLSDLQLGLSDEERETRFLTRAQAAFCLTVLAEASPENAAMSVTDGHFDEGIDAIYFDSAEKTLYIVQSKWSKNATKTIEVGDCHKFLKGIEQLIRSDFSKFNERIRKRESELTAFLKRSDVRITLAVVYSSSQDLGEPIQTALNNFLEQQNNVGDTEVFNLEMLDLSRLYSYLSGSAVTNKIKLTLSLSEWGTVDNPYRAYYGQVQLSEIAGWAVHGKPLLVKNLRFYRGSTDINNAIDDTLNKAPEHFWYLNNGITILCSKIEKTLLNGDARNYGVFECEGVSIVNGGQTVGVVWEAAKRQTATVPEAKVHVRLISLEKCPEDFSRQVTRGTNTQNPIQHRDFAALDPNQQRLAREMELDGKTYSFKSGDVDPIGDQGCNIEDATIAMACASSIALAVQAKREIGQLWKDIEKPPYTTLFSNDLQAREMWAAVQVSRAVSEELEAIDKSQCVRGELVAVHGNRFILHMVFRDPEVKKYHNPNVDRGAMLEASRTATRRVFRELATTIEKVHTSSYLANVFKSSEKCKSLVDALLAQEDTSNTETGDLFPPGYDGS